LNPVSASLLNAIDENTDQRSGEALLVDIAAAINFPDTDAFLKHGATALKEMNDLGLIIGTRS
jgi:hypothetical protein